MHAWNPELMQTIYPPQRDLYVPVFLSGAYARKVPGYNKDMLSIGFGQVTFMAAEMGDQESRQKMLDYAERNFHPVWEQGAYYYPRNSDYLSDVQGNSHGVSAWTGNVLLALARLDKGGGFQRLYREPWTKAQLDAPQITNVDDVLVNVSQAFYDARKRALIVTLKPGPVPAQKVGFSITGLASSATYSVVKDGQLQGKISRTRSTTGDEYTWRPDGTVAVTTTLTEPHSFVVVAE